ncbi:hypothetical protein APHAL10511_006238 [Amanita phalloides]|nr:hypothetical protein APHAL10511_006238 [Amanita phalloides]
MARRALASRNMKQLSIAIPPTLPPSRIQSALALREDEDLSPSAPYAQGPVLIIPGIWLGSEDNARDKHALASRSISAILNVAQEVDLPFDSAFHYLKLPWSHGQQNLVDHGFKQAMTFTDAALQRGDSLLIHCQCGISRSATLVIALVMRAAAERASNIPPEVWSLKGMHDAYSYVKQKSKWISPNMSLIYQLLEYQKSLKIEHGSTDSSDNSPFSVADEDEWGRQQQLPRDNKETNLVMHEAQALDRAMEDRFIARRSSNSSLASSNSGYGMGRAWRSRYAHRRRTGSIASCRTNGSFLSEDLVEKDEEAELLGIGGGFDSEKNAEESSSSTTSPDEDLDSERSSSSTHVPPSAPAHKAAFRLSTLNIPRSRTSRRPPPIRLPPVPSSPITIIVDTPDDPITIPSPRLSVATPVQPVAESPQRPTELRKHAHRRDGILRKAPSIQEPLSTPLTSTIARVNAPSQTLFVFPPSPTAIRTPSTLTVTSTSLRSPSLSTPRVSLSWSHGRPRSFMGVNTPATPTTGFTKLNVRGYVGIQG